MNVLHHATDLNPGPRKVCLAIGVFDGVHLGHQQIIRQTVTDARQHGGLAMVVTFDRHPCAIVAPDRVPPLIYSPSQKLRAIESLGADALLEFTFDLAFSKLTGEQFIRSLASDLNSGKARSCKPQPSKAAGVAASHSSALQSICVGADFVFGHKRSGNVPLLRQLGGELNFQVHGLAAVALDGETVSSTRIREVVRLGDFDAASQMLGRAYSLAGQIVRGDQLGRQLGFPTANLHTTGLLLPPNGVYAAHASVAGKSLQAVLNIGRRPSVSNPTPSPRVEVHLLDFQDDLYGRELEVTFVARLREEQRFDSLDELKAQIARDIAVARRQF